jgi:hypothetical protein
MVATRAVKRAVVDSRNPLQHEGLRGHIFSFVGAGHWWFVAQVSRAWKLSYQNVEDRRMQGQFNNYEWFTCTANMTLKQAAFSSAACCSLATDSNANSGLCLDDSDWRLHRIAGQFSDLDTLHLALERGLPANDLVIRGAAESASLGKVQWLHEIRRSSLPWSMVEWATRGGNLELLTWLTEHGCKFNKHDCAAAAAAAGHEHVLCYLREQGCEWDEETVAAAAECGHLSSVKWLLSVGCLFDAPSLCESAARSGSIEMMVYARQQGCELNATCMTAKGRLSMCQYLRSEGCAWDTNAPKRAAFPGHADTLRWLHEQGCPWIAAEVCTEAAEGRHVEVMRYLLHELALPTPELLQVMLNAAGAWEHLEAAQWLRQQGADWPDVLKYEGIPWSATCLAWARQQGCTAPAAHDEG